MIHPHNGIFSHRKKWSTDTCCDMNEPWKDAKWKKQTSKAWFHLFAMSWMNKSIQTEIRFVVAKNKGNGRKMSDC